MFADEIGPNHGHYIDDTSYDSPLYGHVKQGDELMAMNGIDLTRLSHQNMIESVRGSASENSRELTFRRS